MRRSRSRRKIVALLQFEGACQIMRKSRILLRRPEGSFRRFAGEFVVGDRPGLALSRQDDVRAMTRRFTLPELRNGDPHSVVSGGGGGG